MVISWKYLKAPEHNKNQSNILLSLIWGKFWESSCWGLFGELQVADVTEQIIVHLSALLLGKISAFFASKFALSLSLLPACLASSPILELHNLLGFASAFCHHCLNLPAQPARLQTGMKARCSSILLYTNKFHQQGIEQVFLKIFKSDLFLQIKSGKESLTLV